MTITAPTQLEPLAAEALRHLQALLRCDTTNPPGNEALAATYIREQMTAEGIEPIIFEPAPGRASVWARLPGTGAQRPLLLVSHTDVVPVERDQWTADPFGGELRDGFVYGRGAVDMKQMAAFELAIFLHHARAARNGEECLSRDLLFLAVADEERSGVFGMQQVVAQHPEMVDAEYALNEGGGFGVDLAGTRFYLCEAGQKGSAMVTLRATGMPGHASIPHFENAVVRLGRAVWQIGREPLPMHVTASTRAFVRAVAARQPAPRRQAFLQLLNPVLSETVLRTLPDAATRLALRATIRNTVTPTILRAGRALNVIPGEAIAEMDARLIPGQTAESLTAELRRRVRDPQVEIQVALSSLGYEMETTNPLITALTHAIERHDPGAIVVPYLFPAVSDSRFLAPRGVKPYGFIPHQPETGVPPASQLAHAHDERISLANVAFGVRVLADAVARVAG
ncbi:MAG TPA: M20/M25/M40 family metallo-hydrolase [Ktedonobacterales bacterium]